MPGVLFYTIPVGLCFGVFSGSLFAFPDEVVPLLLVLSFALAVLWRRGTATTTSPLLIGSLFFLCAGVGLLRFEATLWTPSPLAQHADSELQLEGIVVHEPDVRASVQHVYIEEVSSGERILVTADKFLSVSYGDRVIVEGMLSAPEAFAGELGRTFNYPGYLRARGVSHSMFFADVSVVGHGMGNPVISTLLSWKAKFMQVLESHIPEPQAGLAEGLLLGVKRALGDDLETAFRATGVIHIVVLSGYNLMIVADALMRILSFFFKPVLRMVFGIGAIVAFALMVGLSATVVRASLMAGLLLYARATGRNGHALRALCVAGIAMLLINPYLLVFDPGFQLSFLATLGLILLAPTLEHLFKMAPTMLQIREFITATIATQIMVLPLLLYLIGEFSMVAVMVNVLVLPMVPVAMFLSFLVGLVGMVVPVLGLLVGYLANLSLVYILSIVTLFAKVPFASVTVPAFPFWVTVCAYGCIGYVLWRLYGFASRVRNTRSALEQDVSDWTMMSLSTFTLQTTMPKNTNSSTQKDAVPPDSFPFR